VASVDLSVDGGRSWRAAEVTPPAGPHGRAFWRCDWDAEPGPAELVARARDASGAVQPLEPYWNRLGYGNNVVVRVPVRID
jgi:hypothetical protein